MPRRWQGILSQSGRSCIQLEIWYLKQMQLASTTEQPTTRLVVDQKVNMEDHITHVINKARIAKRHAADEDKPLLHATAAIIAVQDYKTMIRSAF